MLKFSHFEGEQNCSFCVWHFKCKWEGGASTACFLSPHTDMHWKFQKLFAFYVQIGVRKRHV